MDQEIPEGGVRRYRFALFAATLAYLAMASAWRLLTPDHPIVPVVLIFYAAHTAAHLARDEWRSLRERPGAGGRAEHPRSGRGKWGS